ncbi:MAG: hypothetical protein ACRDMJ_07480 [Solirubrobacteraceae bacterium]
MRSRLPVRIVSALVALVTCAWFALGIRQAHDSDLAASILSASGHVSPAAARHAGALLHAAAQLNPDRSVDLLRSQLALKAGHPAQAQAIALDVTRAEPQSLDAWLAYGEASSHDPRAFAYALRQLNRLAPPVH